MSFRGIVKRNIIGILPKKYQMYIERQYYAFGMRDEIEIIKQLSDPYKVALDIGANKGTWTIFLNRYFSHVYCFEPIPQLCDHLTNRFSGFNVSVENCALGDINGVLCLNIPYIRNKQLDTRSSLVKNFNNELIMGEKVSRVDSIEVMIRTLDEFKINNVGFIKIDVEGSELQVLQGGKETIKRNRPNMIIEIEQQHHKDGAIYSIFRYIEQMGYKGKFISNNKLFDIKQFDVVKMQEQLDDKDDKYINNFIFTPM